MPGGWIHCVKNRWKQMPSSNFTLKNKLPVHFNYHQLIKSFICDRVSNDGYISFLCEIQRYVPKFYMYFKIYDVCIMKLVIFLLQNYSVTYKSEFFYIRFSKYYYLSL